MNKHWISLGIVFIAFSGVVFAHEGEDFTTAKALIDSGISCTELTDDQLEHMGDYYMEQMRSGEAHELMDEMMGGEESETLKQTHISMAKRIYCKEYSEMMGYGMMSSGMMGNTGNGTGMMKNSALAAPGYFDVPYVLQLILLAGLIVLVGLGIFKLWKSVNYPPINGRASDYFRKAK